MTRRTTFAMIYYRNRQTMTSPSGISCHVGDKLAPFPSDSIISDSGSDTSSLVVVVKSVKICSV